MTQEDKDYLEHSKLWLDSCENLEKEMDLDIKFSIQEISIRQDLIDISTKRKEINRRQIIQFKHQLVAYCRENNIDLPSWLEENINPA